MHHARLPRAGADQAICGEVAMGDYISIAALVFLCVFAGVWIGASGNYPVSKSGWYCTESRVVVETLPRREECTQYTRKEIKYGRKLTMDTFETWFIIGLLWAIASKDGEGRFSLKLKPYFLAVALATLMSLMLDYIPKLGEML